MKQNWAWRSLVVAALGGLIVVGSWGLIQIADAPNQYLKTVDFRSHERSNDTKFDAIQRTIIEQGQRTEDKLDAIQEHLMK